MHRIKLLAMGAFVAALGWVASVALASGGPADHNPTTTSTAQTTTGSRDPEHQHGTTTTTTTTTATTTSRGNPHSTTGSTTTTTSTQSTPRTTTTTSRGDPHKTTTTSQSSPRTTTTTRDPNHDPRTTTTTRDPNHDPRTTTNRRDPNHDQHTTTTTRDPRHDQPRHDDRSWLRICDNVRDGNSSDAGLDVTIWPGNIRVTVDADSCTNISSSFEAGDRLAVQGTPFDDHRFTVSNIVVDPNDDARVNDGNVRFKLAAGRNTVTYIVSRQHRQDSRRHDDRAWLRICDTVHHSWNQDAGLSVNIWPDNISLTVAANSCTDVNNTFTAGDRLKIQGTPVDDRRFSVSDIFVDPNDTAQVDPRDGEVRLQLEAGHNTVTYNLIHDRTRMGHGHFQQMNHGHFRFVREHHR